MPSCHWREIVHGGTCPCAGKVRIHTSKAPPLRRVWLVHLVPAVWSARLVKGQQGHGEVNSDSLGLMFKVKRTASVVTRPALYALQTCLPFEALGPALAAHYPNRRNRHKKAHHDPSTHRAHVLPDSSSRIPKTLGARRVCKGWHTSCCQTAHEAPDSAALPDVDRLGRMQGSWSDLVCLLKSPEGQKKTERKNENAANSDITPHLHQHRPHTTIHMTAVGASG